MYKEEIINLWKSVGWNTLNDYHSYLKSTEDGGDSAGAEYSQLDFSTANKTTLSTFGVYTNYLGKAKFFAIGC